MRDGGPEDHPAPGGLFLAARAELVRKPVLHVDVALLEDADAVARGQHVLAGVQLQLDDDGAVDLLFRAGRRVFAADAARLVEHVGGYFAYICTNENLEQR